MQRILFTLLSVGVAVLLGTGQAHAESYAGAASGSCSGNVDGWGHFHAHTHEHVYVIDGDIVTEDHDFDFGGFLQGAQNARFLRMRDERWAIFRSGDFDLAVPFVEGAGLFARDNQDSGNNWVKLCSY
ncbi:hypothetical protein K7711_45025 [Nocardia sp. CA2R105]|uniref:hypothetical protein n=1 Tax=Nocardia coffeae TaxID=2873381 RepID=UPI001CA66F0C|nr:hypothetical protein [Nocardia coffeae]MBY8863695.1 hypothetical protein [Nocardia coffeae]